MNANPILLQKKYARIVELFARKKKISIDKALGIFYHSEVYQLMRDGISDMHCMSDSYLEKELEMECEKNQGKYLMNFEEKYYEKIVKNIEYLETIKGSIKENFDIKKYKDPDGVIDIKNINGINIQISSDGICGIKKIIKFSKENEIIDNYKLIRKRFLIWPAYAMSINQQRGYKNTFDDRIDLLLMDLKKFYDITGDNFITNNDSSIINYDQVKEISGCVLARAYLNVYTLIWLRSFENFEKFIDENELNVFVKRVNDKYIVENWTENDKSKTFCKKYFDELIKRLKSN